MFPRIACLVIGYLFGIVQTAYIYGKMNGIDIREHGSGNAGTTNALRVLGKKAGAIVFAGGFSDDHPGLTFIAVDGYMVLVSDGVVQIEFQGRVFAVSDVGGHGIVAEKEILVILLAQIVGGVRMVVPFADLDDVPGVA